MDALQISGTWYISSRRAAKENGYNSDYIGQLIRSGKVKGQKVGHSWYVSADSLAQYFKTEVNTPTETPLKKIVRSAHSIKTEEKNTERDDISDTPDVASIKENRQSPHILEMKNAEVEIVDTSVEEIPVFAEAEDFIPKTISDERESFIPKEIKLMTYLSQENSSEDRDIERHAHKKHAVPERKISSEVAIPIRVQSRTADEQSSRIYENQEEEPVRKQHKRGNGTRVPGVRSRSKRLLLIVATVTFVATTAVSVLIASTISVSI